MSNNPNGGGSLSELCAWAARVSPAEVPPDVAATVRAQLVGLAGSARRLAALPSGAALGGGAAGHTARMLLFQFDDHQVGGRVGAGLGPAAFEAGTGSLAELVATCAAAAEVGARVGLAGALQARADGVDSRAMRAAAAVVRARAVGAGAEALHAEVAGALAGAAPTPLAEVATPDGALRLARAVHGGGTGAEPAFALPAALGAAGAVWLSRTVTIPRYPGSAWANVALDALDEVLRRHLKAADKRLRAEQIERIEVRVAWGGADEAAAALRAPALGAWSLREAMGRLVAHHELGPELLEAGAGADKAEEVATVASRVVVEADWALSLRKAREVGAALGPVLGSGGVRAALRAGLSRLPAPAPAALSAALAEAPLAALAGLRRSGGLGACTIDHALYWPVELKLYTTRGGWWPERRAAPSGTGAALVAAARARYADDPRADALLAAPGDRPAADWLRELLA